jgi:hypothetical protein
MQGGHAGEVTDLAAIRYPLRAPRCGGRYRRAPEAHKAKRPLSRG